jgi:hypothetical protein
MTLADYEEMVKSQHGRCAICDEKPGVDDQGRRRRLEVDHCHSTGAIRGLLCGGCNSGLAGFKDSVELIDAGIAYLGVHAVS